MHSITRTAPWAGGSHFVDDLADGSGSIVPQAPTAANLQNPARALLRQWRAVSTRDQIPAEPTRRPPRTGPTHLPRTAGRTPSGLPRRPSV